MEMSGTPRFRGLSKLHSKNRLGQGPGEDALEAAGILGSKFREVGNHRVILVIRTLKESGKTAPG